MKAFAGQIIRRRLLIASVFVSLCVIAVIRIELVYLVRPSWYQHSGLRLTSKFTKFSNLLQVSGYEKRQIESFRYISTASTTTTKRTTTILTTSPATTLIRKKRKCFIKEHPYFPACLEKFNHMKRVWGDKCYRQHGVDGSNCSILDYLTKIEPYCMGDEVRDAPSTRDYASPRYDLEGLLKLLPEDPFSWLRQRATLLWPDWVEAGKRFMKHKNKWKRKKVLAFMGAVDSAGFLRAAGHGGPLGELVQWTDLICGLYILGYDVEVAAKSGNITSLDRDKDSCATYELIDSVDVIYLDIVSIQIFASSHGTASTAKYRCMFRILDSFGTYPEFNVPNFPHSIQGGPSGWGRLNMITTQFLTLYPHTHDNSFLGFVVGTNKNVTRKLLRNSTKEMALLYAKHSSYFMNDDGLSYLKIVSEYFDLHATAVVSGKKLPSYITNHGPVTNSKVQELLRQSKLFVGFGFPFEGPGPMEAMAGGAIFLQPQFDKPQNKLNNGFFGGKPTFRKLMSQSPYMEEFVGEPYCYTIDIKNTTLLRSTLRKIQQMKPLPPKIPKEFTNEGMLERIHIFTEHMDYCNPHAPRWPPIDHLQTYISQRGQSCKDVCMSKGLVCERSYFLDINTQFSIERHGNIKCESIAKVDFLHPPSFNTTSKTCYLQENSQHFSCMFQEESLTRLCPCRDYELEQVSLCNHCLR